MTNPNNFPTNTSTEDLKAVARSANGTLRSALISDGTVDDAGFTVRRPATSEELERAGRVGLKALTELDARGESVSRNDEAWVR